MHQFGMDVEGAFSSGAASSHAAGQPTHQSFDSSTRQTLSLNSSFLHPSLSDFHAQHIDTHDEVHAILPVAVQQATLLHQAVLTGHVATVQGILETEAPKAQPDRFYYINLQDERGWTALCAASALEDEAASVAILQLLLLEGASVESRDAEGCIALHWASAVGGEERVQLLVDAGSEVNAASKDGETPLHKACRNGRAAAIGCLLRNGANSRFQSRAFLTPYDVAGCVEGSGGALAGAGAGALSAAASGGAGGGGSSGAPNTEVRQVAVAALLQSKPELRTLLLHHPDCLAHVTREGHQVRDEREGEPGTRKEGMRGREEKRKRDSMVSFAHELLSLCFIDPFSSPTFSPSPLLSFSSLRRKPQSASPPFRQGSKRRDRRAAAVAAFRSCSSAQTSPLPQRSSCYEPIQQTT